MFDHAERINARSSDNESLKRKSALDGIWSTLINSASAHEMKSYIEKSPLVLTNVIPSIVNDAVVKYEHSQKNLVRSLGVLYEGGISSRKQYNRKRSRETFETDQHGKKHQITYMKGCKVPKLMEYKKVRQFVNSMDIGELKQIPEAKKSALDKQLDQQSDDELNSGEHAVSGCYRDLESTLLKLANLYLVIDNARPGFLNWFGSPKGMFQVSVGADGAPFGKYNQATAWLISFLNVADRVGSCDENYLICGANCSEEHQSMVEYGKLLRKEMEMIEKKSYIIEGISVSFSFELIPADMKWLAFISGELPNSATYFSSFSNVSQSEKGKMGVTCGSTCDDYFKPWNYQKRLQDVKRVEKHKSKLTPKQIVGRTKVTQFIASQKSRQEFEPILGPFIDKAVVEPLHLANNNWEFLFTELLAYVINSKTVIPSSARKITDLPKSCCLRTFLSCLKKKVKANRLYNSILRWFREGRKSGIAFHFRFTGQETRLMCNGFSKLVKVLLPNDLDCYEDLIIYAIAFMAVNLRDAVSIFSRITDMKQELLANLNRCCVNYFNAAALFLSRITVSVWTLGYIVPVHANKMFEKFKTGLGLNTMQGREAKHQRLGGYAKNTTHQNKWQQIFRHEYISLVWLREQNPYTDTYSKTKFKYVPVRCNTDDFCNCGLSKDVLMDECKICSSKITKSIKESIEKRDVCTSLHRYLKK